MSGEKRASAFAERPGRRTTRTAVRPGRKAGVTFVGSGRPVFESSLSCASPETKHVFEERLRRRST